jgi:hypothetical protein
MKKKNEETARSCSGRTEKGMHFPAHASGILHSPYGAYTSAFYQTS